MIIAALQTPLEVPPSVDPPLDNPLSAAEFKRLAGLAHRLPLAWTASVRRRRFLLLALAAPGFLAVFSTPLHRNFFVMAAGFAAFAAALAFRSCTERVFVRAEAAALWPPALPAEPPSPQPKIEESHHA